MGEAVKRHWSFIVTQPRYLYPLAIAILCAGAAWAFRSRDATHLCRVGNFIIGLGVWMSMRATLRDGINRFKNAIDDRPTLPGHGPAFQVNPGYFNKISYSIGDAILQVHGFALVMAGSVVGSYGDLFLQSMWPEHFVQHPS